MIKFEHLRDDTNYLHLTLAWDVVPHCVFHTQNGDDSPFALCIRLTISHLQNCCVSAAVPRQAFWSCLLL